MHGHFHVQGPKSVKGTTLYPQSKKLGKISVQMALKMILRNQALKSNEDHDPTALPLGKRPGLHYTGGWVGLEASWLVPENLAPTEVRAPDLPARSVSLYRLRYPCPLELTSRKTIQ